MIETLELLLALSRIDSEIQDLSVQNERLPERIEELEEERRQVKREFEEVEAEYEELGKDRTRMERELDDLQTKLADLSAKQLVIKTNEEYAALSHEITFVRGGIEAKEEAILGVLEQSEDTSERVDESRDRAAALDRELEGRIVALRDELSRLDDALAIKRDERLRVTTRIDRAILGRYERILESKGDVALAVIADGACSGCYVTLPPQMVVEVRRADRLIECQSCGRILVWRPEADGG